ncbi:hypothetical protein ACV07N_00300 [Roseivirga echinicomitans]
MKRRALIILLFFGFGLIKIDAQEIKFQGQINAIKTSTDGKYLIIADGPLSTSAGHVQNILVFDTHNRKATFFAQNSVYGGFSGKYLYMAFSDIIFSSNKYIAKGRVVNMKTLESDNFGSTHFILGVYDDGSVLATNAKIGKNFPGTKSQSGLYIFNREKWETTQIIAEKVDLEKFLGELYEYSPDYHFLWKYGDHFEIYDLRNAKKLDAVPQLPSFNYSQMKLSTIDGPRAVISRYKLLDPVWDDYYFDAEKNELIFLGDQHKPKMGYKLFGGNLYSIDIESRIVSRLKREADGFIEEASWSFSSVNDRMIGDKYRFELISETNIAAIPTKEKDNANLLLVDIRSNEVIDDLNIYPTKSAAVVSAPKVTVPKRPLYNSTLLNSFDPLALPWGLDYNSLRGRSIDGLEGASDISPAINKGNLSAIGEVGQTQEGDLILLSMWRGIVSGSDVTWFKVSVFGTDGTHKQTENIGATQKSMGAITTKIDFGVRKEGNITVIRAAQKTGEHLSSYKFVIDGTGHITRTSN